MGVVVAKVRLPWNSVPRVPLSLVIPHVDELADESPSLTRVISEGVSDEVEKFLAIV